MIKRLYAECTLLFQLIKLINAMRRDPTDTINASLSVHFALDGGACGTVSGAGTGVVRGTGRRRAS